MGGGIIREAEAEKGYTVGAEEAKQTEVRVIPSLKELTMDKWEVSLCVGSGVSDTVGCKANSTGNRDNKGGGGGDIGAPVADTAMDGGEVEKGGGMGGQRRGRVRRVGCRLGWGCCVVREATNEGLGCCVDGLGEVGGPFGWTGGRDRKRGVFVEIRFEEVLDGRASAEAEELGAGLTVMDGGVEFVCIGGEGVKRGSEEGGGEVGITNGAAEKTDAGRNFGAVIGAGVEEGKGPLEVSGVGGGEVGGGAAGDGSEDFGFLAVDDEAMGRPQFSKAGEVEREVDVLEESVVVVKVGETDGGVIMTGEGTGGEFLVEDAEDLVEDEGSEDGAEGAALGEAFFLWNEVPRAVGCPVPTVVGGTVDEVKERKEGAEGRVACKGRTSRLTRGRVEHVDKVEQEKGVGGGMARSLTAGDVFLKEEAKNMEDGLKAPMDPSAHLAFGEEVGGEGGGKVGKGDGAKDAAEAGANANGAEFVKVGAVFVQSKKVSSTEIWLNRVGDIVVGDELQEIRQDREEGAGRVTRFRVTFKQAEVANDINVVRKGAGGRAFLGTAEGGEQGGLVDGEGFLLGHFFLVAGVVRVSVGRGRVVVGREFGRKEFMAEGEVVFVQGGNGTIIAKGGKGTTKFILVGKALGTSSVAGGDVNLGYVVIVVKRGVKFAAGLRVCVRERGMVSRIGVVVKRLDVAPSKEGETVGNAAGPGKVITFFGRAKDQRLCKEEEFPQRGRGGLGRARGLQVWVGWGGLLGGWL